MEKVEVIDLIETMDAFSNSERVTAEALNVMKKQTEMLDLALVVMMGLASSPSVELAVKRKLIFALKQLRGIHERP